MDFTNDNLPENLDVFSALPSNIFNSAVVIDFRKQLQKCISEKAKNNKEWFGSVELPKLSIIEENSKEIGFEWGKNGYYFYIYFNKPEGNWWAKEDIKRGESNIPFDSYSEICTIDLCNIERMEEFVCSLFDELLKICF